MKLVYLEVVAFICTFVFVVLWLTIPESGNWEAWSVLSALIGFGIELYRRVFGVTHESRKQKHKIKGTAETETVEDAQQPETTNLFLSQEKIGQLVKDSGLDEIVDEAFVDTMALFKISQQQTWLVATTEKLYFVRDDAITRISPSMIQWGISLRSISKIDAYKSPQAWNVIDIGPKRSLLYSKSLYENTRAVEDKVKELVKLARNSA